MKKILIILASLFLFSCNVTKQTILSNSQNFALDSSCPVDGNCKIEVFENKTINVLNDGTGSLYYQLQDDLEHKVIQYTYSKKAENDLQDAHYKEELIFEIENTIDEKSLQNENLQQAKMLFGRFCYCKGKAGNFKVTNGNLIIKNDKIVIDFEIKEVPQITKNISIAIKK